MEMELVLAGTETALGLGRRWSWAGTEMELGWDGDGVRAGTDIGEQGWIGGAKMEGNGGKG